MVCDHSKPEEVVQRSLANLKEMSTILNAKAPQDAAGFKVWLELLEVAPLGLICSRWAVE